MIPAILIVLLIAVIYALIWLVRVVYRYKWNTNLSYYVSFSKKAVFEGENVFITESLSNRKYLPLPWVHVRYDLSRFLVFLDNVNKRINRGTQRNILYKIGMNKTASRKSTVLCTKRGYYQVSKAMITSNNILMSERVTQEVELNSSLTVYPRMTDFSESVIPLGRITDEILTKRFTDPDPFTFKGIREYQQFDTFRQINFNATAKTGKIMSNVYDFTMMQNITIILNVQDYSRRDREFVHEEAIRIAAYLCRKYIDMRAKVSLVCPSSDGRPRVIDTGGSRAHLETIYTALAHINLKAKNQNPIEIVSEHFDGVSILISSYNEADIYKRIKYLKSKSMQLFWVIPYTKGDDIMVQPGADIVKYEVSRDG
jgi:uncharacterized protein (DUF58 family)